MKKLLLAAVAALLALPALAADLAVKSPFGNAYPTTRCGMYYGIGTGGSASAVTGAQVGTQIIGAELDAILGYTCPLGTTGFWFVEGSAGANNFNGSVNGFAASGPLVLIQRAGAGSPLNALINPFGNSLAVPSLPLLPNGITAGPALPYFFAGMVEQQLDVATRKQWLIAPLVGAGFNYRLSNGSVADVWAGWQLNSQSICTVGVCGHSGNGGRVGIAFKF
jgi:opacity protein-like surface antigen